MNNNDHPANCCLLVFEGISKLSKVLLVPYWIGKELFSVYIWSPSHDGLCGLETRGCSRAHKPIEAQ